jgi:F0F1-type ATP synthase assembly protein I
MPKPSGTLQVLGSIGSLGFAFVIAVVLGWWFGSVLDRWLGTAPWFTFVFFFLGLVAGGLNVFRTFGRPGDAERHGRTS